MTTKKTTKKVVTPAKSLSDFVKEPTLTRLTFTLEEHGEIEFWAYDYIELETYFDFLKASETKDIQRLASMIRVLAKNADGTPLLTATQTLPPEFIVPIMQELNVLLGKSQAKTSTQKVLTPAE